MLQEKREMRRRKTKIKKQKLFEEEKQYVFVREKLTKSIQKMFFNLFNWNLGVQFKILDKRFVTLSVFDL